MPEEGPKFHPHIFVPRAATSERFTSPKSGRSTLNVPQRGRAEHADHLLRQLRETEPVAAERFQQQRAAGIDEGNGIYLVFQSTPDFDLKFESLDFARSGIELLVVRKVGENQTEATVFVPEGKLTYFLNKITKYRNEDTTPRTVGGHTRPKNEDLVASIANIQLAALQALWTDLPELYPDSNTDTMWEVWLRRGGGIDHVARLRERAAEFELRVGEEEIQFIDRTVVLVYGKGQNLARSNDLIGAIAELRLAKTTADFFHKYECC